MCIYCYVYISAYTMYTHAYMDRDGGTLMDYIHDAYCLFYLHQFGCAS